MWELVPPEFGERHSSLVQHSDTHNGGLAALAVGNLGTLFTIILLCCVCVCV